ncbi:hydroxyacid dehydrogenase [Nanohaloarchaea archaeon H01]|nr:hydroxyacid dehydrogenase [Nanohaloarchaea archaeon H01]
MIMRVAWFDTEEWEREFLKERDHGLEIEFFEESLEKEKASNLDEFDAVTVFVSSEVDEKVVEELEVSLIATRSTGFDHIATGKAAEKGIMVSNVPNYGGTTVAEHTFGLILSLSRKINKAINKVEEGEFDHSGLEGFDLKGKKLGVIGTGTIGKNVIRIANGFDMHVIAFDPEKDREAEHELGFMYVELEDLLQQADVISLHCPLNEHTEHLLSEEEFEKMDDTVLINTARGEIVDTEALIEALEQENVKAAGLDVLEEECYLSDIEYLEELEEECDPEKILEDHILMERDDVVITPHNAFNSREAKERIEKTTLENLKNKKNIVNKPWS